MVKKIIALMLVILLLFSLSSCSKNNNVGVNLLKDQAIVQGMGVDYVNGGYKVTFQIFDVANAEGTGQSVKGVITTNYSSVGETVSSAIYNSQRHFDKETFLGQNKILIINEELAKKDLSTILDFYSRAVGCRPEVQVALTKDDAKSIIEAKCEGVSIPAEKIGKTLVNGEYNGKSVNTKLFLLINDYEHPTSDVYMPVVKTFGKDDENVTFDGIAVFYDEKLKGYLNDEQTRGLLFINSKISTGNVIVDTAKLGKITLKITSSSTKKKAYVDNGVVKFDINIKVDCAVSEMGNGLGCIVTNKDIEQIQKLASKVLKDEVNSTLKTCLKKYQCDVFKIGRMISQSDKDFYEKNKDNWHEILPDVDYNVNVKCKVKTIDSQGKNG